MQEIDYVNRYFQMNEPAEPIMRLPVSVDAAKAMKETKQAKPVKVPKVEPKVEPRAVPIIAPNNPLPVAIQAAIPVAAPAVPVPDVPAPDISEIPDADRFTKFWQIVGAQGWHNFGEGELSAGDKTKIRANIEKLSPTDNAIFVYCYEKTYIAFKDRLEDDDMFARNGILGDNITKTVSHFIGLGKETYDNMYADLEYCQTLIQMGECQNFNDALPEKIRI